MLWLKGAYAFRLAGNWQYMTGNEELTEVRVSTLRWWCSQDWEMCEQMKDSTCNAIHVDFHEDALSYICTLHKFYQMKLLFTAAIHYAVWTVKKVRETMNNDEMLAKSCRMMAVSVMGFTNRHSMAGMGCFAPLTLAQKTLSGWYNCASSSDNPCGEGTRR